MKPHKRPTAAKKISWSRASSGRTVRKKYSAAPATARKIPRRLAELSPKFTIAVFPRQIYVNELTAEIGMQVGNFNSKYPGSAGERAGRNWLAEIRNQLLPL
jgi:transcription elongation GreA/GreB family factor